MRLICEFLSLLIIPSSVFIKVIFWLIVMFYLIFSMLLMSRHLLKVSLTFSDMFLNS